jgi:CBS domain-containing protein
MPSAERVHELMSKNPITLPSSATVLDAAREMRSENVGAIVVEDKDQRAYGIVTDRDIIIRAVADGRDAAMTLLSDICSTELTTLSPDDTVAHAIQAMRQRAIRRLLVVDADNRAVGVISLGDLAVDRDAWSVLGKISAAPPSQ